MIACDHPHDYGKLCPRCYMALAEPERHFYIVCSGAAQANNDVVVVPNGVTPERAAEIAQVCGARMVQAVPVVVKSKVAPVESTQTNLFGDTQNTVNAL